MTPDIFSTSISHSLKTNRSVLLFMLTDLETNTVRASLQKESQIVTTAVHFGFLVVISISKYKFLGGGLFSLVHLLSRSNGTFALAEFLKCGKSCVIVVLDAITPYLIDSIRKPLRTVQVYYSPIFVTPLI